MGKDGRPWRNRRMTLHEFVELLQARIVQAGLREDYSLVRSLQRQIELLQDVPCRDHIPGLDKNHRVRSPLAQDLGFGPKFADFRLRQQKRPKRKKPDYSVPPRGGGGPTNQGPTSFMM